MTFSTEWVGIDRQGWRERLAKVIEQDPLIVSKASRRAVDQLPQAPRAVYLGVGLCTRTEVSRALSVDLLGMILPAEAIRRAVGARQLVVLVADAHAMTNHLPAEHVDFRARVTVRTLARLARRLGLTRMLVIRASALEEHDAFHRTRRAVSAAADGRYHPYVVQQVTDVAFLTQRFGSLLKVGWTLGVNPDRTDGADERMFDSLVSPLSGTRAAFVYCWPGRRMDDRGGRAPPYIVLEPERRILLTHDEHVPTKVKWARRSVSRVTIRALRNHLRRLAAGYTRVIGPVRGASVEARVQTILESIFRPGPLAKVVAPLQRPPRLVEWPDHDVRPSAAFGQGRG